MEVVKLLNIKAPILQIKALFNGTLSIVDAQTTVRIFSTDDYKVIGGFKSNIQHERTSGALVDVAFRGDYSLSAVPKSNKAALFSVENKELLYKVGRHQGEIETVGIDPNSRYCVTCGQDGKVFIWVIKTARLAFSMPSHTDFVTSITFNDNGHWIATGSFDRTINLLNLTTMKQPIKLIGHGSVIVNMIFLSDTRLLSAEKEGALIVWDTHTGKVLKRLTKMNDTVTAMCMSHDKRFVFVGTKLGYVSLYDMQSMELMKQRYLKENEEISSMATIENDFRLVIGTVQGNVRFYSLFEDQEAMIDLLRQGKYKAFYLLLDENPLLLFTKAYELAEKIWNDIKFKAIEYLEKGERQKAKDFFELFSGIPQKNGFISQILQDYEKYAQFQISAQEGRFPLAYSLSKQCTSFQDSETYQTMEARWKKLFSKAQELIVGKGGEEEARALLAPYRGISEKTVLIQQLFAQKQLYEYFKKVITSRNFIKFFELIKNHPFLKEFSEYKVVMDYADKLYIQAMKGYQNGELLITKKACEILSYFPDYSKEANEFLEIIKIKSLFLDAIASENHINAFSYLASHPFLYETPEAQKLENHWNKVLDQALRYVIKGEIEGLRKQFEFYLPISAKYANMASVFSQCYAVQLEQKLRADAPSSELENGIRNYVGLFGIDDYILFFFNLYKRDFQTNIDLKMLKKGSIDTWSPSMLISDITSKPL